MVPGQRYRFFTFITSVLPREPIQRTCVAWISRNRRLARDFERYATTVAAAFIRLAMIRIMLRRLTRSTLCP